MKKLTSNATCDFLCAFGAFLNKDFTLIKKKIKTDFLYSLREEDFLSLLEGDNPDSYYENKYIAAKFVGIELRFRGGILSEKTIISSDEEN